MTQRAVRRAIVVGTAICIVVVVWGGFAWHQWSQRRTLPFALVGRRIYSEAFASLTRPSASAPQLHDRPVIGDPVAIAPDLAAELREILSSPSTYTFEDSMCFEPGMAISFGDGADRVDVLICLLCNRVVFYCGDSQVGRCLSGEGNQRLSSVYQRVFGSPPPTL